MNRKRDGDPNAGVAGDVRVAGVNAYDLRVAENEPVLPPMS